MTPEHNSASSIFIVDDKPTVCDAIAQTLHTANHKTKVFYNAKDCLKQISLNTCKMVISDYKMSEMNGLELLTQIRQLLPLLPVIIITGFGDVPLAVRAIKSGAQDFIEKPLKKESLLKTIHRMEQSYSFLFSPELEVLSRKEKQILQFLMAGKSSEETADVLFRSQRTIEDHRHNILKKLNMKNFAQLLNKISPHQ